MAPIPPVGGVSPRLVLYHQTTHDGERHISLMDLVQQPGISVTHIIIAAIHLHVEDPYRIHINDHPPSHSRYDTMWEEKKHLETQGIKFLCMLGGHAAGSYDRDTLDAPDQTTFRKYYNPFRDMLRRFGFSGVDLDIEQPMSLPGVVRLIDALHADFGPDFDITLAPVATAMISLPHISGFDYFELESQRGHKIAWYNVQFYNNWGDLDQLAMTLALWHPSKLVVGLLTSNENGSTRWIEFDELRKSVEEVRQGFGGIGGIMGWEYFNSRPGGRGTPWIWAKEVSAILWPDGLARREQGGSDETLVGIQEARTKDEKKAEDCIEEDADDGMAPVPTSFEYDSDNIEAD